MRKTWLNSNSVCLAMGDAVALNLMFEDKQDHELFFQYWKKYLGKMATLLNYQLTPTGWILLFKTRSSEEIRRAYHAQRSLSVKAKRDHTLDDVSRILSEHFRIFLSQFVRRTNAKHRRSGTKVKQRFHRYVFHDKADYTYFFNKITRRFRELSQKHPKYQADESQYDKKQEMLEDSIWQVGTRMYQGLEHGFRVKFGVVLMPPTSTVLRKFISQSSPPNFNTRFT